MQSIPTAANTIKEMLADQAAPSQQIDDIISRYLQVRDSSSIDKLEHELMAIFAGGVDHAADIVAGLEALPRTLRDTPISPQQGARDVGNAPSRVRATFRDSRPRRFTGRIGTPVNSIENLAPADKAGASFQIVAAHLSSSQPCHSRKETHGRDSSGKSPDRGLRPLFSRTRRNHPPTEPDFPRALCESPPLYQQQTAPTQFIAAAANATHRLFAVAAVAIGALHDASAERMRLGLEHLRRVRKPQAPPAPPTHEMRVADLIDAYADPALHPDIERIARAIASKAYRNGYCYATQEKIAAWTGIARSTLQLRLHEMERLHLSHVERRLKTSSITLLADGTLDALRLKKINKIKVRERTAPYVVRTFTAPATTNPHETDIRSRQKVDSWPKNTTCSQQSKSSNKSEYRFSYCCLYKFITD